MGQLLKKIVNKVSYINFIAALLPGNQLGRKGLSIFFSMSVFLYGWKSLREFFHCYT